MNILDTLEQFDIQDKILGYSPLGNGHINATYLVTTRSGDNYVLQKINNHVFKDVDLLMSNIYLTTKFLSEKGYETLEIVRTKDNQLYYHDVDGYYRVYTYIKDAVCYEGVDDLDAVYNTAKAFGALHKSLFEFPVKSLGEVIPNFHNTEKRYEDFLLAVNLNAYGRVNNCYKEILRINKYKDLYSLMNKYIRSGEVKLGVTHNDPKINNVLFDKKTNHIRAVIDLDTMMPGSYLYDYGDALRSLMTGEYEDTTNLDKINVDFDIFKAYTRGYLSEMKDYLSNKEKELLPFAVFLLSMELAIRFLSDYLAGDKYFRVNYEKHNLVRARTQLKLAEDIYNNLDTLQAIVKSIL